MYPSIRTRAAVGAAALLIVAGALAVRAQDATTEPPAEAPAAAAPAATEAVDPEAVVARVGDETITEKDLEMLREALESQLSNIPADQQRGVLVDTLVSMELLAKAGRDAGMEQTPEFQSQLDFLTLQALRNAYVEKNIVNAVTDAEMQQAYQELVVSQHTPEQEVHARHILVEKKEDAERIIGELKAGGSFEELAKQSKDPSGQNGGDLGFFSAGQMVPEFETAAFALEPGQFTQEPVETQFGWHIIKVEEKRMSEPPTLAQVEAELRTYLVRQKFETVLTDLRDKYQVEIIGQEPAAQEPAAEELAPAGDAPAATEAPAEAPEQPTAPAN
jgi:peptidyl-prolyl cis-trans isomerase C